MKNLLEFLQHYQLRDCNCVVRALRETVVRCFEDEMKGKSETVRAERLGENLILLAWLNLEGSELELRCRLRVN